MLANQIFVDSTKQFSGCIWDIFRKFAMIFVVGKNLNPQKMFRTKGVSWCFWTFILDWSNCRQRKKLRDLTFLNHLKKVLFFSNSNQNMPYAIENGSFSFKKMKLPSQVLKFPLRKKNIKNRGISINKRRELFTEKETFKRYCLQKIV